MTIHVRCNDCETPLKAADDSQGMVLACPECESKVTVPIVIGPCPSCSTPLTDRGRRWRPTVACALLAIAITTMLTLLTLDPEADFLRTADWWFVSAAFVVAFLSTIAAVHFITQRVMNCPKCTSMWLSRKPVHWDEKPEADTCPVCARPTVPAATLYRVAATILSLCVVVFFYLGIRASDLETVGVACVYFGIAAAFVVSACRRFAVEVTGCPDCKILRVSWAGD